MTRPIPDRAEIALEYPDKFYAGTFERSSRFEAHLDPTGFAMVLEQPGGEDVRKHDPHAYLVRAVRRHSCRARRNRPPDPQDDILHRDQLRDAVAQLYEALTITRAEAQSS